jgi:hypothetical protein
MTDSNSTTTEDHHVATVQPQEPEMTSQQVDDKTIDTPDTSAMSAEAVMPADRSCKQVETEGRVGKTGEMPNGKVDEEVATATGPRTETTDHHRTDGVSLATPVSSPQLIKPPPPLVESTTTLPIWTPPRANKSHRMGQAVAGGNDNDGDKRRVHERVDNPAHGADMSMDETTASASASASTDAATPYHEPAKAIRDPGHPLTTSASHGYHDEAQCKVEPTRPPEDPADATGDDEHRPDAPTEPPDMPEGTKG